MPRHWVYLKMGLPDAYLKRALLVRRSDQCEAHLEAEVHRCLSGRSRRSDHPYCRGRGHPALQRHREVHNQVQRAGDCDCPDPTPGEQRGQYAVVALRSSRQVAGSEEPGSGVGVIVSASLPIKTGIEESQGALVHAQERCTTSAAAHMRADLLIHCAREQKDEEAGGHRHRGSIFNDHVRASQKGASHA